MYKRQLFASCKEILAKYDPHYDPGALPANLEEAKSDLTKMTAMQASIAVSYTHLDVYKRQAICFLDDCD